MRYKNISTGAIIDSTTYNSLSYSEKSNYRRVDEDDDNSSGDFLTSAAIGAATDSAIIGGIVGGDMLGGIVGDMLDGDLFD